MYLKSLTLKGFKSFADRTLMTFDPGLTVVVGPNGSGKSNVSDAILWVLGEQSAKMLRGQAMEDVIFSGSSARKPVGVAEVTLVLDNSDHTLPIEFDEVGVTRRMYRSGESEYLINGAPARLMDIQDILHDSGLGKDTHSIISQGKLDSVLASRPEDRRGLIEEAADISKHRRRKERSERKLARMDENLRRAKDISREVARQLRPLERQVDRAQQASEIQSRLAEATTTLAVDDLRRLQASWNDLKTRDAEAEAAVELAQYRLGEKQRELDKLQSMLEQKGLFVGDLGAQRRRTQQIVGRIDSDMRLLEEKGKNMVSRISEMRATISSSDRQRTEAASELNQASDDLVVARAERDELAARLEELEPAARQAQEVREKLDKTYTTLTAELRDARREVDAETAAYSRLRDEISNAELEDSMYESRITQLDESIEATTSSLSTAQTREKETQDALDAARKAHLAATEEVERLVAELDHAREAEDAAREKLSSARASLSALVAVDEAAEAASPLVAEVTAEDAASQLVECRLGDLIEAPTKLEGIVETLLGDDLTALVVADTSRLATVASLAQKHVSAGGTATLVPLSSTSPKHSDATGSRLLDELSVDERAADLFEALLGDVYIAGSIEEALASHDRSPESIYVTLDGACVLSDGRVTVGSRTTDGTGALERKRRIRSLERSMSALEGALTEATAALEASVAALSSARDKLASSQGEVARLEGDLHSISAEATRLTAQLDKATAEREAVQTKRGQAAERIAKIRPELDEHHAKANEATEHVAELTAKTEELEERRSEASRTEAEATKNLSDIRLSLATVTERTHHLETRTAELAARIADLEDRSASLERSARATELLLQRINPLHERYDAVQSRALEWADRLRDRASLEEADSDSLKKTIGDAREQVSSATSALERAKDAANALKVEAGQLEVRVEGAIQAIRSDGAYDLEEALLLPAPEDRSALEVEVATLEKKLASIGPVNQVAMEEYTRLKERADYIDEQVADLEAARKALARITAAIDRKMRNQFLVTFDKVNENFQAIFSVLFPGGRSHLELTDPDNPSDSGVEVIAQPKGKRIAKMTLMSGGEKSLTALALLFAVYKTRTVPFYVFDEVEAALDDANLDRLLDAIDQLRASTQLIVISHQRRTMEKADVLYGVSMQADGVSHVVSQRLDHETGKVVDA